MTVSRPRVGTGPAADAAAPWSSGDIERSLAARFRDQAARSPDRTAVVAARGTLTYGELDRCSNRIANAILERAPGGGVALYLGHDLMLPAAVLGVIKAGGFYVPLEPRHPEERNAFVLQDSGASALVTDRAHRSAAHALAARAARVLRVVDVDEPGAVGEDDPAVPVSPRDPCFVVYTSGSTGRPKGVCQLHRNILHATAWYAAQAALGPGDRMSLLHSATAVAGATALYGALLNGAAVLPFDPREAGLGALADWIDRAEISCLHAVPTLFRRLGQFVEPGRRFPSVRLLRLGGEAATRTEWELWRSRCSDECRLLVGLGSTEALSFRQTVYGPDAELDGDVVPAGDAVPDKEVLVVDGSGDPVGVGEVGEIVVRSEFLFRGYWGRPDLTAQVLGPDPLDARRQRLRTGDLGRLTDAGVLYHVGRADSQVKVAGHRVETAEIEHALRRVPAVRDAVVVPRGAGPGGVRLVAVVAVGGDAPPPRRELRAALARTLPEHMIPSVFVFVDELPLLPGGKVDRLSLAREGDAPLRPHVGPRNPVEETLVGIWQRALGARDIGVNDELFAELGGDSLAAVEILTEVEDVFGQQLPLSTLYEASTVARLGARLLEGGWTPPASGRLVVNGAAPGIPLFAICGAFGHALRLLLVGQRLGPGQPFHALQPPGMDWDAVGCATIEAMAAHYLGEIRRTQPRGPYRLLGTSFGGVVAFEVALQLRRSGEQVDLLAMVDTSPPDCLTAAGLDRAERRDWTAGMQAGDRLVAMGVRVARQHRAALDNYVLARVFDGSILYLSCDERGAADGEDRRPLWEGFASGGVRVVRVPGRHGNFHREPQLSAVVAGLRAAITERNCTCSV